MYNLSTIIDDSARDCPDKEAVVLGDVRLTYRQTNALACQVANGLKARGIRKGDKVALTCPNLPYFPIVWMGILKAGATMVPLSVLLRPREIQYHLSDSEAVLYICFEGSPELPMGKSGYEGFNQTEIGRASCRERVYVLV